MRTTTTTTTRQTKLCQVKCIHTHTRARAERLLSITHRDTRKHCGRNELCRNPEALILRQQALRKAKQTRIRH